jgi:hypothetical protein
MPRTWVWQNLPVLEILPHPSVLLVWNIFLGEGKDVLVDRGGIGKFVAFNPIDIDRDRGGSRTRWGCKGEVLPALAVPRSLPLGPPLAARPSRDHTASALEVPSSTTIGVNATTSLRY